jgi:hypothetical protein
MKLILRERLHGAQLAVEDAPVSVPELQQLARLVTGEPRAVLRRLLMLLCEQLAMDVAVVCSLEADAHRTVRVAVMADGTVLDAAASRSPVGETWCGHVLDESPLLVKDVTTSPELQALPEAPKLRVGSYAGVVLHNERGIAVGTLCAIGHARHATLNVRDGQVIQGLADVIAPLVLALSASVPAPRCSPDLAGIADAVSNAQDVEHLSRPLLDALHDLTGVASS